MQKKIYINMFTIFLTVTYYLISYNILLICLRKMGSGPQGPDLRGQEEYIYIYIYIYILV